MGLSDDDREALGMRPVSGLERDPVAEASLVDDEVDALVEAARERRSSGSSRRAGRGRRGDGLTGAGLDFGRLGGGSDE